jgi:WD40 repeat protein
MPDDIPTPNAGDVTPTSAAEQHEYYDAFISYSHAADGSLAPALQHGLQTLAKPLYQRKALRVFRDQTNLAATPELWSTIEEALAASRFFILLASPAAAGSPWVQQELDWWHRHRAPERLLIGVTHGAIAWDPVARDFDWHTTDALPRSLSRWFRAEPLWVNLRWTSSKSALSHRDPRLQEDLATLAAPLRGMSKDDLIGRDLKQHHKAVRLTVTAITLLLLLTVAAGAGAWLAIQQRNTAQRQTVLAESRALASGARSTAPTQLDLALLLAQRSVQMNPTPDALASLFSAVSASPQLAQFIKQRSPLTTLIARPGGGMIVGDTQGTVSLLDTAHTRQQPLPAAGGGAVTALAESGPGKIVVSGDADGTVRLWSLSPGSLRWRRALGSPVQAIAVSPDASAIAAVLGNNTLVDLDAVNGGVHNRVALGDADLGQYQDHVGFLQKDIVLVGDVTGATQVWRMAPQPYRLSEHIQQSLADRSPVAAWSSDGRTYVYAAGGGTASGTANVIQAATGQAHGSFDLLPATTSTVAIDDSTNRLAYISNGLLAVRDRSAAASKAGRTSIQLPGFANAEQIAFTADGRWLIAGGGDTLAIFDLHQRSGLATELPTELAPLLCHVCFTSLAVDPHGHLVVWTDGTDIVCYDVRSARQKRYPNADPYSYGEVAFTPDGSALLSYAYAGTSYVGIWPTSTGCPSSVRWIRAGAYSLQQLLQVDSNRVIITSLASIGLLDLRREKIVRTYSLPGGSAELSSAAVSSDAHSMAVSLTTGKIVWFDINSGAVIGTNGSESGAGGYITFLPGSQRVAQTTLTAVVLWDLRHGQVGRFEGSGSAQKLAFSHDGQLLFALDTQDNLRIWNTAQRTLIGSLQALPLIDDNGNPVAGGDEYGGRTSMALDDNNNLWLAAPSAHPTRWTLSPPIWSEFACTWADRTLTGKEWLQYVATTPPADLSCRH